MKEDIKNKLLSEFMNNSIKSIKIGQKDIAIELGINTRSVRRMKKETIDKFNLVSDALKYRKIIGELDLRIKKATEEDTVTYFAYKNKDKIIGFDFEGLLLLGLNDREMKNLEREDILETTISDQSIREKILDMRTFL